MPLACVWGVRRWALSHARLPVLGACGRGPPPTDCGCGGCEPGDQSPTPQRALLRAVLARCGGATCLRVGCPQVGRPPTPDRPSLGRAAWARYPLAVGAGGVGVGTRHQPHSARSCELALRAVGAARGRPGVAPPACVWGSGVGRSPTPARPSLGRAAGARYPLTVAAGGVSLGTRCLPHSAHSCELSLRAVGAPRGRPGGAPPACVSGVRGLGVLPRPTARPSGVRPGPATHWLWVPGVWALGPVTNPTARALALWGVHKGAWGGAPPACLWGIRGWALTHARPAVLGACGRGPLPTCCGCRVRAWSPAGPWHLVLCSGSSCVVRASRFSGTRWPLLLGT